MLKNHVLLSVLCLLLWAGSAMAMGGNGNIFGGWECTFERDHLPPLTPEADRLFQEARALQKSAEKFTAIEEKRIFTLYTQAAQQGHWKAMQNLANCYTKGFGTQKDYEAADKIYDAMVTKGIPSGYYGKYVMLDNRYVAGGPKKAEEFLHKAADAGYPAAQNKLGYYYMYPEHDHAKGLRYFVCAARQGYAKSAQEIGFLLEMEENYLMAAEYYYRAVGLGDYSAGTALQLVFMERGGVTDPKKTFGFPEDLELAEAFRKYFNILYDNPGTRIPDLFKKHPIPENTLMTREQSRAMSSDLKDAFGGKWPDEIFPELAPDYMPPTD